MENQEKRGLFSHYLLLAGEAIQFRPLRSFSSSLHKDEKKRIWSDRLIPYKLKIKTALARAAEQSLALTGIKRAQRDFFTARVRSFGVLFFSCGFFQILSYFLKDTLPLLSGGADNLILGVAMIFLTLLCSFSRGDVNYALERSFLFRAILRPVFGVGEWEIPQGQSNENLTVMFLSGIVMALIAVAVSPSFLVVLLGSLVLTLFVFARPEAGLICSAAFLPVLPTPYLTMLLVITLVSFFLKCCIGKRSLVFSVNDPAVIVALFPVLFFSGKNGALLFLALFATYFLPSCLLRTVDRICRVENVIVLSAFFCSVSLSVQHLIQWIYPSLFLRFPKLNTVPFLFSGDQIGPILAMMVPVVLGWMRFVRGGKKVFCALSLLFMGAGLFFIQESGIWLSVLLGVLVYFVFSYRRALTVVLVGGLSAVVLLQSLPTHWTMRALHLFGVSAANFTDRAVENIGFFAETYRRFGFIGIFLVIVLLGFFLFSCFRFCARTTQKTLFPMVMGAISSVTVFFVLAVQSIAFDDRILFFVLFQFAIPQASRLACSREEDTVTDFGGGAK